MNRFESIENDFGIEWLELANKSFKYLTKKHFSYLNIEKLELSVNGWCVEKYSEYRLSCLQTEAKTYRS